jgi:hypothetical protein
MPQLYYRVNLALRHNQGDRVTSTKSLRATICMMRGSCSVVALSPVLVFAGGEVLGMSNPDIVKIARLGQDLAERRERRESERMGRRRESIRVESQNDRRAHPFDRYHHGSHRGRHTPANTNALELICTSDLLYYLSVSSWLLAGSPASLRAPPPVLEVQVIANDRLGRKGATA